jgi:hypothetical protein
MLLIHGDTGILPVGDVLIALSRRLKKKSRQRELLERSVADAIVFSLREVPAYRHHGQDAQDARAT